MARYSYSRYTVDSPSALKRLSHRTRFDRALELLELAPDDRVLDYGAADGQLLRKVYERRPEARLCGYEPRQKSRMLDGVPGDVTIHGSLDPVAAFRPTKIACLEVLEHLDAERQREALANFKRLLPAGGLAVVSVPIEIGPASVAKNAVRVAIDQRHRGITFRNVLRSLVGATRGIARGFDEVGYTPSHIGFDYRALEREFDAFGLRPRRHYSPFRHAGTWFNSQVLFVLRRQGLAAPNGVAGNALADRSAPR